MNFRGWLNQTWLRRPSLAVRRLALLVPATILLFSVLWGAAVFGAARPYLPEDETPEQRHWRKVHEREGKQKGSEEQLQRERQQQVKESVADLVQAGAAMQQELIVAQDGPPPVRQPSIFEGKGTYVQFSLAGLLVAVLTAVTLIRHKRDAEIRALSGNYLSDGTDVARFEMPALFALPPPSIEARDTFYDDFTEEKQDEDDATKAALKEFFARASERVSEMRTLLSSFGKAFDDAERRQVVTKLHGRVCELKGQANCWDLRPIWQMSSALELLLDGLIKKGKEATPSTLSSIAGAVDVLGELCVPGVRPDLIITPPISVLAVDDDPLCLRAVVFALQKAEMTPDRAVDGEQAVALAAQKYYDVIFMDIQMPGIDGLEACTQIHKTKKNEDTPVVFVTVRSDFATRAESILKGGSDLMAKPFLMFEITVKALTYAMRKRLHLQRSADRQTLGAALLSGTAVPGSASAMPSPALTQPRAIPAPTETAADAADDLNDDLDGDLFTKAPEYLAVTRKILEQVKVASDQTTQQEKLGRIYLRVQTLANKAKLAQLEFAIRAGSALESLLKRLHQNPRNVSPSTLNTVANALDVLDRLCVGGVERKLAYHPAIKILVVEDDPVTKRAVVGTLQLAFEKPDSANDGVEALALASEKLYDVIFSDIEMPNMGGFGLCTRIREGGLNQNTPVVFITSHIGFEVRAQAEQSGGSDFIAKPFLPIEITVKALTFALEGRLRKINAGPVLVSPLAVVTASNPNPPPELLPAVNS